MLQFHLPFWTYVNYERNMCKALMSFITVHATLHHWCPRMRFQQGLSNMREKHFNVVIFVYIQTTYDQNLMPDVWYQHRNHKNEIKLDENN